MKPGPYLIWGLMGAAVIVAAAMFLSSSTNATSGGRVAIDGDRIQSSAILGGQTHNNVFENFAGGDIHAFMGGVQLDLTGSTMSGEIAVLELFAMMGGIEIRIPEDWTVVNEMHILLGGVEDDTRSTNAEGSPRLVLQGVALMGGVSIKN